MRDGVTSAGEETYAPTRAALQQHRRWSAGAQEELATRLMDEMDQALEARIRAQPPDSPMRKALELARSEIAGLTRTAGNAVAQELAKGTLPM